MKSVSLAKDCLGHFAGLNSSIKPVSSVVVNQNAGRIWLIVDEIPTQLDVGVIREGGAGIDFTEDPLTHCTRLSCAMIYLTTEHKRAICKALDIDFIV